MAKKRRERRYLIKVLVGDHLLVAEKLVVQVLKIAGVEGTRWLVDVLPRGSDEVHVEHVGEPRPGNLQVASKRLCANNKSAGVSLDVRVRVRSCACATYLF
jgi:hypothetical protein